MGAGVYAYIPECAGHISEVYTVMMETPTAGSSKYRPKREDYCWIGSEVFTERSTFQGFAEGMPLEQRLLAIMSLMTSATDAQRLAFFRSHSDLAADFLAKTPSAKERKFDNPVSRVLLCAASLWAGGHALRYLRDLADDDRLTGGMSYRDQTRRAALFASARSQERRPAFLPHDDFFEDGALPKKAETLYLQHCFDDPDYEYIWTEALHYRSRAAVPPMGRP